MNIIDVINRLMESIGGVISGESVSDTAKLDEKNAEIARLSDELDEARRLAETRLERIREFEKAAAESERGPVPPIKPPLTNGGRIRAMTNRELVVLLRSNGIDMGMSEDDMRQWLDENAE